MNSYGYEYINNLLLIPINKYVLNGIMTYSLLCVFMLMQLDMHIVVMQTEKY